jgi:hypothetical protein
MATSGTVSATTFNTLKVIDTAFRRCRLPAQRVTPEMQSYAQDALYLYLSSLANAKAPSWCIEKILLPMYQNQPVVTLPVGTVEVMNLNYRTMSQVTGTVSTTSSSYKVQFSAATQVVTVGVKWATTSSTLTLEVSNDDITWTTVGTVAAGATSGEWSWADIYGANEYLFFRITAAGTLTYSQIYLANTPNEIPMGVLNQDQYVQQNNFIFPSRPNSYWFQRDLPQPVLNLWPAPYEPAETCLLVCWRQRHIMDVGTLQQDIEVPQRWMDAIIAMLAFKVAEETPEVEAVLIPQLEQRALVAVQLARDGDNDGSSTFIQPYIAPYTR